MYSIEIVSDEQNLGNFSKYLKSRIQLLMKKAFSVQTV